MLLKEFVLDITFDFIDNLEEISGFSVFLLMSKTEFLSASENELYRLLGGILCAYIVHKLKTKIWDKKNNWVVKLISKVKKNGKKNNI